MDFPRKRFQAGAGEGGGEKEFHFAGRGESARPEGPWACSAAPSVFSSPATAGIVLSRMVRLHFAAMQQQAILEADEP
jgi:hypothetical protein